jgi:hypothetical protein
MSELAVTIYEDDGAVVFGVETDDGEMLVPLAPHLADEIADQLKAAAAEARRLHPENEQ